MEEEETKPHTHTHTHCHTPDLVMHDLHLGVTVTKTI